MRSKRKKFYISAVAITGYTNTGKSTLLNALTDSKVIVQDKLFSTLDPTVRRFVMPNNQKVLFIDTVGFLDELPHHLIEAFKATLEEVVEADLVLHLVDAGHPKAKEQADAAYKVLSEIGAIDKPIITVLNKIDKVDKNAVDKLMRYFDGAVRVSAVKREGFEALINTVLRYIGETMTRVKATIPLNKAGILNFIYENGVVTKKEYKGNGVYIEANLPARLKTTLDKKIFYVKLKN